MNPTTPSQCSSSSPQVAALQPPHNYILTLTITMLLIITTSCCTSTSPQLYLDPHHHPKMMKDAKFLYTAAKLGGRKLHHRVDYRASEHWKSDSETITSFPPTGSFYRREIPRGSARLRAAEESSCDGTWLMFGLCRFGGDCEVEG
ncbi:hypothetical protein K402DRAFT_397602 [Aulographum hederae CBS 113979]|uniref:Uncharacterized protein n=1 Tax=Aulographum hederae CBS 113979 TaxID=1176131 RepID=A0A6G1GNE5_9PEZI|nr:hypothetical protein K402DRAFT_397602 [Aulographum hederae CBS 113979]